MIVPLAYMTDKQVAGFMAAFTEISDRIAAGEKMSPKKIKEICARKPVEGGTGR